MNCKTVLLILGVLSPSLACPQCGCGNAAPPTCLPPPSPYEAMAAALAYPPPSGPTPNIPAEFYAPLGPILDGCGPPPGPVQVIQAPPVVIPGPETPIIPLPAPCLPPAQIIAHKCVVSKAVLKPQVYQRIIQVPTIARFLKKSFSPVLENIAYTAVPQCGVEPVAPLAPFAPLLAALPSGVPMPGLPASCGCRPALPCPPPSCQCRCRYA